MTSTAAVKKGSAIALLLALCACHGAADGPGGNAHVPGDTNSNRPFAGLAPGDTIHFLGTEPFWGGEATGTVLTYTTPEKPDGAQVTVNRFAGRGGLALGGMLEGARFDMAITEAECSDGMSDHTYPFTVTLRIGDETRQGCAWSAKHPFKGDEHP